MHQWSIRARLWQWSILAPIALASAVLVLAGHALAVSPEEVTFRFAPPDGLSFVRKAKTTKTITDMGVTRTTVEEFITADMFRRTDSGYSLSGRTTSVKAFSNDKEIELPFPHSAFVGTAISYDMNDAGKITASRGYDELLVKMKNDPKNTLPPEALKGLVNAADAAVQAEWNCNVAGLVGKTAKIGDTISTTSHVITPLGGVTVSSKTTIVERLKYEGKDCVRLKIQYKSSDEAFVRSQQKALDDVAKSIGLGEIGNVTVAEVNGQEERIVDPVTMLSYSESVDRTSRVVVDVGESRTIIRQLHHKKEVSYEY